LLGKLKIKIQLKRMDMEKPENKFLVSCLMLPDEIKNSHRKDFHKSIIFSLFKCQSFFAKNFQQHSSRLSTDSSNFPRAKEVKFHIYNIHFAGTAFCAIALQNLLRNGFLEQFIIFFRADAPSASFTGSLFLQHG